MAQLHIDPPTSVAGDQLVLRAEMDLHVGLTACSAEKSNGGVCKPIDFEILDAQGREYEVSATLHRLVQR